MAALRNALPFVLVAVAVVGVPLEQQPGGGDRGAVLLCFRRTATLGACVLLAVMSNVVLVSFYYGVSVKLFSCTYLAMILRLARAKIGGRDSAPIEGTFELAENKLQIEGNHAGQPFSVALTRDFPR